MKCPYCGSKLILRGRNSGKIYRPECVELVKVTDYECSKVDCPHRRKGNVFVQIVTKKVGESRDLKFKLDTEKQKGP